MSKKQNATVGKLIREKMGYTSSPINKENRERPDFERDDVDADFDDDRGLTKSQKKKKSVRIFEEKENHYE
jgi:hypothetical protein